MRSLVLTIGGSCAPIITSISQNKPEKVYFICSDDTPTGTKGSYVSVTGGGKVCGKDWRNPDQLNIVKQIDLSEDQYSVVKLKYFDDHNFCYEKSFQLLKEIREGDPNGTIIVDYTGGTKSMTVGLVMAAADLPDITVSIVKGERSNLIKVDDGTQRVKLTRTNYSLLMKQRQIAWSFIASFDYGAAAEVINNVFRTFPDIPRDFEAEFQRLLTTCTAFDKWDKFQHGLAKRFFDKDKKSFWQIIKQIDLIIECKEFLIKDKPLKKASGYEVVKDILLNADRRASQRKYDDAVSRLYRALELIGQIYLKKVYGIKTEDVDLKQLPDELSRALANDGKGEKVALPLFPSLELIEHLDNTEEAAFGPLFSKNKSRILNSLKVRNESILAHGFIPVSESDYQAVYFSFVEEFIHPLLEILEGNKISTINQFPKKIDFQT